MRDNLLIAIPARGGSRRLPGKALRHVGGKPLIWYTLEYVRRLDLQHRAVVVTDDDAIAAYTLQSDCAVGVVREPPVGPDDESTARAIYRAVRHQTARGKTFEVVVNLAPTCPVRSADLIQHCLAALTPEVDAVRSVVPARMHPEWCLRLGEHDLICPRGTWDVSQSYEPTYELSGCVDVFWARVFSDEPRGVKEFWSGLSSRGVVHDDVHCDVDTRRDMVWFEFLLKNNYTIWDPEYEHHCRQQRTLSAYQAVGKTDRPL